MDWRYFLLGFVIGAALQFAIFAFLERRRNRFAKQYRVRYRPPAPDPQQTGAKPVRAHTIILAPDFATARGYAETTLGLARNATDPGFITVTDEQDIDRIQGVSSEVSAYLVEGGPLDPRVTRAATEYLKTRQILVQYVSTRA